jgi:hypothetical protein
VMDADERPIFLVDGQFFGELAFEPAFRGRKTSKGSFLLLASSLTGGGLFEGKRVRPEHAR